MAGGVGTYNPITVTDIVNAMIAAGLVPPSVADIINGFIAVNMAPTAIDILNAFIAAGMTPPSTTDIINALNASSMAPTAATILAAFVAAGMTPPSTTAIINAFVAANMAPTAAAILAAFIAGGMTPPTPTAIVTQLQTTLDPGLAGTSDSLGYRIGEIERHFHSNERWLGKLAVQTPTQWAERLPSFTPFRAISGSSTWGTDAGDAAQVIGTADTPVISGNVRYELHRIFVVDASSASTYNLRLIYGTGTMADAITANQFSSIVMRMDASTSQIAHGPVQVQMRRGYSGSTKIWMQIANTTNNAWIDFFVGLHEYEG